jgi:hypothetical protein
MAAIQMAAHVRLCLTDPDYMALK